MTIKMLESYDAWRGSIIGDGNKEHLSSNMQMAVRSHRQYCKDYVPKGILRETAIKTAEFTMLFWNALVAYIEDEYQLLLSFKLQPKHVLLLLSNQIVQIVTTCMNTGTRQQMLTSKTPCWLPLDLPGSHYITSSRKNSGENGGTHGAQSLFVESLWYQKM